MCPLTLLLACASEPEVTAAPAEPDPPAAEATAPELGEVNLKMTSSLTVGDALPFEIFYTLPDPCWHIHQELKRPEPLRLVFTVAHTRKEGMCAQVMTPQVLSMKVPVEVVGEGSLTVVIDGRQHAQEPIAVHPPSDEAPTGG